MTDGIVGIYLQTRLIAESFLGDLDLLREREFKFNHKSDIVKVIEISNLELAKDLADVVVFVTK